MLEETILKNKDKILNFKPTQEQIQSAELVFIKMAELKMLQEIIIPLENRILKENVFYEMDDLGGRIITDRSHDWLMSDEDFNRYLKLVYAERVKIGINTPWDQCPISLVEMDLINAERDLINSFESLTGINYELVSRKLDLKDQYVELTLRLIVKFVDKNKIVEGDL